MVAVCVCVCVQRAELTQADSQCRVVRVCVCVCVRVRTEERLEWLLQWHATTLQCVGSELQQTKLQVIGGIYCFTQWLLCVCVKREKAACRADRSL